MPRNVPRKNISRVIADVFRRGSRNERGAQRIDTDVKAPPPPLVPSAPIGRAVAAFAAIAICGFAAFVVYAYYTERARVRDVVSQVGQMEDAAADLRELDFTSARDKFAASKEGFEALFAGGAGSARDIFSALGTLFEGLGSSYGDFQNLSGRALLLTSGLDALSREWFALMMRGRGQELIALLTDIRDNIGEASQALTRLGETAERFQDFAPVDPASYLDVQITAVRAKNFLDALIPFVAGSDRHIAVFLYNPSELRPAGGFLGSYADVTIREGNITAITVHDINESDREFARNIVPPRELQGLVKRWRAADANWFFDFPASAEKTLAFLDASEFYSKQNRRFDGAIAVLPEVVSDLLRRTGPIKFSSGVLIDHENFIYEIQKDVQAGQANKAAEPKAILSELTPLLIERLLAATSTLPEGETDLMLAARWFSQKNVMVFFRDPALQSFLKSYGLTGSVYLESDNADNEYLAVVQSNIGGAKTDLFMEQAITFQSQIGNDGTVSNHVIVKREHHGDEAKSWWYRETNHNYLKIFAPNGSQITAASGTIAKTVKPLTNYTSAQYESDSDLKAIEETIEESVSVPRIFVFRESQKTVFGAWTRTELGKTSELTMDYTRRLSTPPDVGGVYTIILEKQAGATGTYKLEIAAPVGFRWEENDLPVFEYETGDLPARLILNLTFERVL